MSIYVRSSIYSLLQIEYDYRQAVKKAIPHLKTLDDEILIEGVGSFQKHNVFDDDWAYLQELQNDMSLRAVTESPASDSKYSQCQGSKLRLIIQWQ